MVSIRGATPGFSDAQKRCLETAESLASNMSIVHGDGSDQPMAEFRSIAKVLSDFATVTSVLAGFTASSSSTGRGR
eukprot:695493-Amphidinium_carterae.1